MKYIILTGLWISFCALHSGMIAMSVTKFLKQKLGIHYRFYRLFYNIISIVVLIPIVMYSNSIKNETFFSWEGYLFPVKCFLITTGIVLFVLGARHYSMSSFLGIAQLKEMVNHNLMNKTGELDSSGILGVIRHPFYAAIFPLIWARNLDYTNLIINIMLSIYVIIGTRLEEQKLIFEFGDAYREYQQKVSMLFPVKWIKVKLSEMNSK